ncbi:formylglycine-generating enzyme family protein [Acaryochloris marina]|uniref:Sulfatase-modifying factor enzyme-like domain-containing protein n=1 Tax=Acaryochloris marina (strain MBIC 11017) TaxID=329726 RepID=A8ZQB6_ACAM1|nr:formylglycine-generating enzyme family protein [Acaryochloris marina]ABW33202.1 conserved hypothetical protein [Acaryochloris marina MBIC11017]
MSQATAKEWIIQEATHRNSFYLENLGNDQALKMMDIPKGEFQMGSPDGEVDRKDDEGPQHLVKISRFFMSKTPISQAQWQVVAKMPTINIELEESPSNFKGVKLPVEHVSWHEAVEFCDRMTQQTKSQYRLPTEAEWEYACRAGTSTPFHFGETITTDLANYRGTDWEEYKWSGSYGGGPKGEYRQQTTPVDQFQAPNRYGLCDMYGNVREWCQDIWHSNYNNAPENGSAWIYKNDNESSKVLRGGSWLDLPGYCRSASRYYVQPHYRDNSIGFRVVCSSPRILHTKKMGKN